VLTASIYLLVSYSTAALMIVLIRGRIQPGQTDRRLVITKVLSLAPTAATALSQSPFKVLPRTAAEQEKADQVFSAAQIKVLQKWQDRFANISRVA
jgi:hypothetical protein